MNPGGEGNDASESQEWISNILQTFKSIMVLVQNRQVGEIKYVRRSRIWSTHFIIQQIFNKYTKKRHWTKESNNCVRKTEYPHGK